MAWWRRKKNDHILDGPGMYRVPEKIRNAPDALSIDTQVLRTDPWICAYCRTQNAGKFCTECGKRADTQ